MRTKFSTMPNSSQTSSASASNDNGNVGAADMQPVPEDLADFDSYWLSKGGLQDSLTKEKSRSDIVAHEMGQLLLKGYKMLSTICTVCDCILMEDKRGVKLCIGCSLDNENKVKEPSTAPAACASTSVVATFKPKQKVKPSKTSSSSSSQKRVVVQGIDLSNELQQAVSSLKDKLASLSAQLYSTEDHGQLNDCLTSISTTVSVLEKIKLIS